MSIFSDIPHIINFVFISLQLPPSKNPLCLTSDDQETEFYSYKTSQAWGEMGAQVSLWKIPYH